MAWWDIDLTGLFNFPQADQGSALASCNDTSGAAHVFYIANNTIINGYFANSTWANQNITPATGPQPALSTALCAFFDINGGHVLYDALDNNNANAPHVHQLTGATWSDHDLTPNTTTVVGSGISSFLDTNGNAHVFYIGSSDLHVHMLSFNSGAWTDDDLTKLATGEAAIVRSEVDPDFGTGG